MVDPAECSPFLASQLVVQRTCEGALSVASACSVGRRLRSSNVVDVDVVDTVEIVLSFLSSRVSTGVHQKQFGLVRCGKAGLVLGPVAYQYADRTIACEFEKGSR